MLIKKLSPKKKYSYTILYEDRHVMAVDKPAGLLTVPIPGMVSVNLQSLVQHDHGPKVRPVHRIDRYTSGIVLFAKTGKARHNLVKQFRFHSARRSYLALVRGKVEPKTGTLVHFLKRISKGFRNVVVKGPEEGGSKAELNYEVLETFPASTLVKVDLVTGLKNQIRVQLNEQGYPLIGDRHYSRKEADEPWIDRQALHAAELGVIHPIHGKELTFRSPLPADMQKLIDVYKTRRKSP